MRQFEVEKNSELNFREIDDLKSMVMMNLVSKDNEVGE